MRREYSYIEKSHSFITGIKVTTILFIVSIVLLGAMLLINGSVGSSSNKKPNSTSNLVDSKNAVSKKTSSSAKDSDVQCIAPLNFTPRLSCPSRKNKYYFSDMNYLYRCGFGMPNCTCYAFGRAYEITGIEPEFSINDAATWWKYNQKFNCYPYGNKPRLGAIAVWRYDGNNNGHVAVVEKISKTTVTFSASGYPSQMFFVKTVNINDSHMGYPSWEFLGFIYVAG
ncbi:MAG: CHAP domain-containing protein [Bacillota bacterium]|nr:CHAP domain-containing protein [Bacillota bacterium]